MRKLIAILGLTLAFGVSAHPGGHDNNSIKYEVSLNDIAYNIFGKFEKSMSRTLKVKNAIEGTGKVYRVVDGDTIVVNVDSASFSRFVELANTDDKKKHLNHQYKSVKFRIANVNTAESVHKIKSKNTAAGKTASNYLTRLVDKKSVRFKCYDHGDYGRPICVVATGNKDLSYNIILNGYSEYVTAWGKNPYYHSNYQSAERKSRQ